MTCTSRGTKFSKTKICYGVAGSCLAGSLGQSGRAVIDLQWRHWMFTRVCTYNYVYMYSSTVQLYEVFECTIMLHLEHCRLGYNKVRYIVIRFTQPDRRKSIFGHSVTNAIKLIYLYAITQPEFWFSTIRLSKNNNNVRVYIFQSVILLYVELCFRE